MIIRNSILSAFAVSALVLAGCGNQQKQTEKTQADSLVQKRDTSGLPDELAESKFSKLVVDIPVGSDVMKGMQESGVKYNKTLLNPASNGSKYITNYKKAVNYGVYGVDFGYISSYNQMQDALQYFVTTRDLAKELGIEKIFDEVAQQTAIDKTGINKDNVSGINELLFSTMDKYLITNKRLEVATLITVGAWIESQYMSLNSMDGKSKNEKNKFLYEKLWEQKLHITNLTSLLTEYKENPDFKDVLPLVASYTSLYDGITTVESITPDMVKKLTAQINIVRAKIVE